MKSLPTRSARTIAGAAAVLTVVALVATACSSESSPSDGSAASAPTSSLPSNPAQGAPVTIGFVSTEGGAAVSLPEMREGAEAAVQYLNNNGGGLAGRPVDLVVCKQQEEPTSAAKCGNEFVEKKVAAVLSPGTSMGAVILPIVSGANIPYITLNGVSTQELTDPGSSALSAGLPGTIMAMATAAKERNMESFTMFVSDGGGTASIVRATGEPIFAAMGVGLDVVPVPLGTPDTTPLVVSGLSEKPGGMSVIADAATCTSVYKAAQTTDPTITKVFIPACLDGNVAKVLGSDTIEGSIGIAATDYLSDAPDSVLYRSVVTTYAPDALVTGGVSSGYQVVMALARASASIEGDVTAATIQQAVKSAKNVEMPAAGGITFSCDGTAFPQLPSICSKQMLLGQLNAEGVPVDLEVVG